MLLGNRALFPGWACADAISNGFDQALDDIASPHIQHADQPFSTALSASLAKSKDVSSLVGWHVMLHHAYDLSHSNNKHRWRMSANSSCFQVMSNSPSCIKRCTIHMQNKAGIVNYGTWVKPTCSGCHFHGGPVATNDACPLSNQADSGSHILGGCLHPEMKKMTTFRHDAAHRLVLKGISKGKLGSSLIIADVGSAEKS